MDRSSVAAALARVAVALVTASFVAIAALHVLEPGADPRTTYLSDYEASPYAWLLFAAYVAAALGSTLLAVSLRLHARSSRPLATGSALLVLAGALVVTFAVWPEGLVHLSLVRVSQGIMLVGMGLCAVGLRPDRGWSAFEILSWTIVTLATLGLVRAEQLFAWPALIQRAYFLLVLAWVYAAAREVLRTPAQLSSGHQKL